MTHSNHVHTGDCREHTGAEFSRIAAAFRRTRAIEQGAGRALTALSRHIERGVPHDKFGWTVFL